MDFNILMRLFSSLYFFGLFPSDIPNPMEINAGNVTIMEFCLEVQEAAHKYLSEYRTHKIKRLKDRSGIPKIDTNVHYLRLEVSRIFNEECNYTVEYLRSEEFHSDIQKILLPIFGRAIDYIFEYVPPENLTKTFKKSEDKDTAVVPSSSKPKVQKVLKSSESLPEKEVAVKNATTLNSDVNVTRTIVQKSNSSQSNRSASTIVTNINNNTVSSHNFTSNCSSSEACSPVVDTLSALALIPTTITRSLYVLALASVLLAVLVIAMMVQATRYLTGLNFSSYTDSDFENKISPKVVDANRKLSNQDAYQVKNEVKRIYQQKLSV